MAPFGWPSNFAFIAPVDGSHRRAVQSVLADAKDLESGAKATLIVSPGAFFGPAGEGYWRLALVPSETECRRAAKILEAVL